MYLQNRNSQDIADKFNDFFVEKIVNLKANIDKDFVSDPLSKLKEKQKDSNLRFSLKTVQTKTVSKSIKKLKNKKSSGEDGHTQNQLCLSNSMLINNLHAKCSYTLGNEITWVARRSK